MAQTHVQIPKADELIAKLRAGREASGGISLSAFLKNLSGLISERLGAFAQIQGLTSQAIDLSAEPRPAPQDNDLVCWVMPAPGQGTVRCFMNEADVNALIDLMCDAPTYLTPSRASRPPSNIERRFFSFAGEMVGRALCDVLKIESFDAGVVLAGEAAAELENGAMGFAFRGRLEWSLEGRTTGVVVEGFQDLLNRCAEIESPSAPVNWTPEVHAHLKTREVLLSAFLEDRSLTLGQIENCRVGGRLELSIGPRTLVNLTADEAPLFLCQLGQGSGHYNVRIHSQAPLRGVRRSWNMDGSEVNGEAGALIGADEQFAGKRAAALARIPVLVQVVLGSTNMPIARMEQLAPGVVIKLDKKIGEKVDVLVNGELLGRGDIAIYEDDDEPRFAVALTEIADADDSTAG